MDYAASPDAAAAPEAESRSPLLAQARAALVSTLFFTLLLGLAYPLLITGVARLAFPDQAQGSPVRNAAGEVIGSRLIAQSFQRPEYLHPRPSAAGAGGYDAAGSSGSNLGPLNPALRERVAKSARELRAQDLWAQDLRAQALWARGARSPVPGDAVTTSGSGLDPHISPANARMQAPRIAAARGAPAAEVERIIEAHVAPPVLGVLGQPTVNVLETNLALDKALPPAQPPRR